MTSELPVVVIVSVTSQEQKEKHVVKTDKKLLCHMSGAPAKLKFVYPLLKEQDNFVYCKI